MRPPFSKSRQKRDGKASGAGSRITPLDHFSLCFQPVLLCITLAASALLIKFKGTNLDFMFKYSFQVSYERVRSGSHFSLLLRIVLILHDNDFWGHREVGQLPEARTRV